MTEPMIVPTNTSVGKGLAPRLCLLAALLVVALTAAPAPATAKSPAPPRSVVLEDCRERAVVVPGVEDLVRQRVPAEFGLVRDPLGRPLLAVVGSRCERYTIDDIPRQTTFAFFVALIESVEGSGCLSQAPLIGEVKADLVPLCNFYVFFAAYNRRAVVRAYRAVFPGAPFHYVRKLRFDAGRFDVASLGAPFHFRAGARTPSPFTLDATVREGPVGGPLSYAFWMSVSTGTAGGRFDVADFAPGQMDATLRAAPGSEMAKLLGTETRTPLLGLANRYGHAEASYLGPGP